MNALVSDAEERHVGRNVVVVVFVSLFHMSLRQTDGGLGSASDRTYWVLAMTSSRCRGLLGNNMNASHVISAHFAFIEPKAVIDYLPSTS